MDMKYSRYYKEKEKKTKRSSLFVKSNTMFLSTSKNTKSYLQQKITTSIYKKKKLNVLNS